MNFVIISHAQHKEDNSLLYAYAPYVREMNLWLKYVDQVEIIAPKVKGKPNLIALKYKHNSVTLNDIPEIQFTSIKTIFNSVFLLPLIFISILKACRKADHIHLRCPGNIGLLGCLVQIFFPSKQKTAKYAGNWDPNAKQPLSYKFQKWILSNTLLTKNMTVLVYGEWENQSKNIKPFFTASFNDFDKEETKVRDYKSKLNFIFIGSLVQGKRPNLAIKVVESLVEKGFDSSLKIFGEGVLKSDLEAYVKAHNLSSYISFEGNKPIETIKETLKKSHFLLLPSKSEGWPKAIAEAMFFGTIPIATKVSCVPNMLGYGNRGVLITPNLDEAVLKIIQALNVKDLSEMSKLASEWSQKFTLEYFESEIKKLLTY